MTVCWTNGTPGVFDRVCRSVLSCATYHCSSLSTTSHLLTDGIPHGIRIATTGGVQFSSNLFRFYFFNYMIFFFFYSRGSRFDYTRHEYPFIILRRRSALVRADRGKVYTSLRPGPFSFFMCGHRATRLDTT